MKLSSLSFERGAAPWSIIFRVALAFSRWRGNFGNIQPFYLLVLASQLDMCSKVLIPCSWRYVWMCKMLELFEREGWPIIFSSQMFMLCPPHGTLEMLLRMNRMDFLHRTHIWEQGLLGMAWSGGFFLVVERYFASSTYFHQDCCPIIRRHTIFPPKYMFDSLGMRMEIPTFS